MRFKMFWTSDDLFDRVSLCDAHHIGSAPLVEYSAHPSMVSPMGHAVMDARIDFDHNFFPRFVFAEQIAKPRLSLLAGLSL